MKLSIKIILLLILILFNKVGLSQSIIFRDIETMIKQPTYENEQYLSSKSFSLTETRLNGNDILEKYAKISEFIWLGWTWKTKDGRTKREISYGSSSNTSSLYMLSDIQKSGFTYKSDNRNEESKGKFIYLESDDYNLQIFIPDDTNDYCLFTLTEK